MPCDSVITIKTTLDKSRVGVLGEALYTLGFLRVGNQMAWRRGYETVELGHGGSLAIEARNPEQLQTDILRETSKVIVETAAVRNGWRLAWTGQGKVTATKQTYGLGR